MRGLRSLVGGPAPKFNGEPDNLLSAWNLLVIVDEMGERGEVERVLNQDLRWLLDRNPEGLGAHQRAIRQQVVEFLDGDRDAG